MSDQQQTAFGGRALRVAHQTEFSARPTPRAVLSPESEFALGVTAAENFSGRRLVERRVRGLKIRKPPAVAQRSAGQIAEKSLHVIANELDAAESLASGGEGDEHRGA